MPFLYILKHKTVQCFSMGTHVYTKNVKIYMGRKLIFKLIVVWRETEGMRLGRDTKHTWNISVMTFPVKSRENLENVKIHTWSVLVLGSFNILHFWMFGIHRDISGHRRDSSVLLGLRMSKADESVSSSSLNLVQIHTLSEECLFGWYLCRPQSLCFWRC